MINFRNTLKHALFLSFFAVILVSGTARAADLPDNADFILSNSYSGTDEIRDDSGILTIDTQLEERNIAFIKFNYSDYKGPELNAVKSGSEVFTSAILKLSYDTYRNGSKTPNLYVVNPSFSWDESSTFSYNDVSSSLIPTGITGIYNDTDKLISYNLFDSSIDQSYYINKGYNSLSFALMYDKLKSTDGIDKIQSVDIFSKDFDITSAPTISFTTAPVPSPEPASMLLGIISFAGIAGFRRKSIK